MGQPEEIPGMATFPFVIPEAGASVGEDRLSGIHSVTFHAGFLRSRPWHERTRHGMEPGSRPG